ncbi:hypothetical protein ASPSYDRAFT_71738 [Aspergillus sydowii CBS 593.65]|uniref:Cytochrome P450 monooxygenase n=1 Tax=Aspergillus sydowii CBS 593.65 TaxID=1036612 RepID=A0A1L9T746_9EURO|nr:uncharacterized protein ASPSYDRAFT_71738 [Aspergillus sydowii CBS 593.65]OJJ55238.1 hypothetical protein ASPSYDRAFT_71738 [Aspergillus sydowii CBS 593.65]
MALAALISKADAPLLYPVILVLAGTLTLIFSLATSGPKIHSSFPIAGLESGWFGRLENARRSWLHRSKEIVNEGLTKFPGCFQVVTASGPKLVLPGEFADEIRNNPHLSFQQAVSKEFFGTLPGFEPFGTHGTTEIGVEIVRGRLTQSLNFITEALAQETAAALQTLCGQPEEWTHIQHKDMLRQLVAQVSARIFIGPELSSNKDWLDVSVNYATQAFSAAEALRRWHPALRPVVHWILPECRKLRSELTRARQILAPVVRKRQEQSRLAREAGDGHPSSKVADTVGWMDEVANGRAYDAGILQLGLSLAAIHTTSELVSGIITDLCSHPEWFGPLCEEMASMIKAHGWTKRALHEMRLTDSMMKESQRQRHFGDIGSMHRVATQPIKLSNGCTIPKNTSIMVALNKMKMLSSSNNNSSSSSSSDPTTWAAYNPRRFLDLRQQPGQTTKWQFVTTSANHLAFGHGRHSCPGRFFAANEIKVILTYLLLGFEWKFMAEASGGVSTDPNAKVLIRVRDQDVLI